jgi:hypothetical protein
MSNGTLIPLPAYINPEAWAGFVEMRRSMGKTKPFTVRAATLILYELQRIKDAGHCPNAALDQSTLRGWADVWPAKEKQIDRAVSTQAQETTAYLASKQAIPEQTEAERARIAEKLRETKQRIKRVA